MSAPTSPSTSDSRSLSTHRTWRIASLFALYAAQGAPEGLLYVALPAWLAARGEDAAAIGSYLAIILLPWSLKLFNGALMDRFSFPAMGRRRPWILGAQAVLVSGLVVFAWGSATSPSMTFFIAVGFLINLAAAFQDVAIDGMAIDLVPEHERGEANGVMWGGKTLGLAASSAASAALIVWSGPAAAGLAIALFVAAAMCFPLLLRERPGERLLPWTAGAAAQPEDARTNRMLAVVWRLVKAMATLPTILFSLGIVSAFAAYGLKTALAPLLAVQVLSWSEDGFGYVAGLANLIGGIFGLLASGFVTDRLGPLRATLVSLCLMAGLHGAMAFSASYWATPGLFTAFYLAHAVVFVLLSVSVYAQAMTLAQPAIGATHFAAFMALLNLGTSWGAQAFGRIEATASHVGVFGVASVLCVVGGLCFALAAASRPAAVQA